MSGGNLIRGIWKNILLILVVSASGILAVSCAGGPSSAPIPSASGLGIPNNAATPYPSGQGTQEGHGAGDLAVLRIKGILSDQDAAGLQASIVSQIKFVVAIESAEDPHFAPDWTPMGNVSDSSLSLSIFSAGSHQPPPHLNDFCVHPFLRLTPVYEVAVTSGKDTTIKIFKGLPVIQQCPHDLQVFTVQLPLQLCDQCKPDTFGKLEIEGQLSDEDSARLSQLNVVNPLFVVNVESGSDPDSADQWTPVGSLSSTSGLSVSASDEFGSLPPHLSDFCLFPFLRLSATYHVEIQSEKGTDVEDYETHNLIQECPAFMDTVSVTLPTFVLIDRAP